MAYESCGEGDIVLSYMYTEKRKDEKELKRMKQDVKGEVRENRRSREKGSNAKIIGCRS